MNKDHNFQHMIHNNHLGIHNCLLKFYLLYRQYISQHLHRIQHISSHNLDRISHLLHIVLLGSHICLEHLLRQYIRYNSQWLQNMWHISKHNQHKLRRFRSFLRYKSKLGQNLCYLHRSNNWWRWMNKSYIYSYKRDRSNLRFHCHSIHLGSGKMWLQFFLLDK